MPVNTSRMADDSLGLTTYGVSDLTAIYCLRAHADNPWVIDRLRLIAEHYEPLPEVLVTDFGSEPDVARKVRDIREPDGLGYGDVPDCVLHSASAARNRGFDSTSADLVSFPRSGAVKRAFFLSGCVVIAPLQSLRDKQRLTPLRRRDHGVDRT